MAKQAASCGTGLARRIAAAGLFAYALLGSVPPSSAQQDPTLLEALTRRRADYDAALQDAKLSQEKVASLSAEIAALRKDHASVTAALIQSAASEKKLAQDIDNITGRLDALKQRQAALRTSLAERRDVLAEVLGALERMGLNPPPAILVRPDDALSSVRSAILLGAVVPELRERTEKLMADLADLNRLTASIEQERQGLATAVTDQLAEKRRLTLLLETKQKLRSDQEAALASETQTAVALANKAASLKDLIAGLEAQADSERRVAEKAKAEEAARRDRDATIAALPENNRQIVSTPFAELRNQVELPAAGRIQRHFGEADDNGGVMQGDMLATQSAAIVTAPVDGSVLYAGPFRSYGQLLILDAGGGYHVVLAGMSRINVGLGQSVLAGEPVGAMGEVKLASNAPRNAVDGPELYVEFRKDGKPVDPTPWWADRRAGRT